MPSIINATTSTGLVTTADNSGSLQLAVNNGTTAVAIDTSQNISIGSGVNINAYQGTSPSNGVFMGTAGGAAFFLATQTATNTNLYLSKSSAFTDAGYMRFYNNTTETGVISLASNTLNISNVSGIRFPATQVASADANTLDDYEEGTWTPNVGGTATYSASNYGLYTKIGNVVTCQFRIAISSIGTGSTNQLRGLPFTSANLSNVQTGSVSYYENIAISTIFVAFYIENNATTIQFVTKATAGTIVDNGPAIMGNNTNILGTVTYRVA